MEGNEEQYMRAFGLATMKHDHEKYPTYDSLPREYKPYFMPLEDGGYVRMEAFRLLQSVQQRTSERAIDILHETAKKIEPVELMLQRVCRKIAE